MKKHRAILGAPFLGVGLAAFMLATLLPIPEAAANYTNYTDTACEGQELAFVVQKPRQDIWDGSVTYKIRITGGSATQEQDYRTPVRSLAFTGSDSTLTVKTLRDNVAENDEIVRLELYEPHTGAWIQRYGIWVQPETLMPQTISFRGTIRDWANAERQGAAKRAGTVWYDC